MTFIFQSLFYNLGYMLHILSTVQFILSLLNHRAANNITDSPEISATAQNMIIYVSACLCVCEWRRRGAYQGALMFVRKSCLTICCLPPQRTCSWNWSSTISCSQRCGQRESKVTAKDLPQSVMGCGGGLMCHGTAVTLRTLSHKHIFAAAKHHLNYLNATPSLLVWVNSVLNALIWA